MERQKSADVVVVGAGVMGTSLAFELARRKAGRVVVLDKGAVEQGMSGRSSALVRMHYSLPQEVKLAVRSLEMFHNWRDVVGRPGDYRETGFCYIVAPHEREKLERNVAMQRELGVDAVVLSASELRKLEPGWVVRDDEGIAYEPTSGYGDGATVAGDFLARAREMGVEYRAATRATGLIVEDGAVRGVELGDARLEAAVVVLAVGPWIRPLLNTVGFDLPIEPEYHQVAILKNPPELSGDGLTCIDAAETLYYRREGRDMTLVGAFTGARGVDPDDFPSQPSLEGLGDMCVGAARRIPALADAGVAGGVTGIYDMTPDSRPVLGEIDGAAGLFVMAGFSGMGFKISPAVGIVMAERILGGRAETVDIGIFRPGRFAAGEPIRAEWEYEDN